MVVLLITILLAILFAIIYFNLRPKQFYPRDLVGYGGIVSVGSKDGYCYATIYHDSGVYDLKV